MSQAEIGNLRVRMGLDTAEFQTGAKRAQSTLAGLSASIKGFAAGAVGALSLGGLAAVLQTSINRMDDLGKAAQKIGIPVEELSKLEYAAKLADVPLDALTGTMARFSRSLVEVQGGAKNDAGGALQALGISATDAEGKLRPTIDLMSDIADEFAAMQDGAGKTAIAWALFGKTGAGMIPLLNGGRAAIAGAGDELARFGGVVTPEAARQAEQFNDNLTRMRTASQGLVQQFTTALLPAMAQLTSGLVDLAKDGEPAKQFFIDLRTYIARTFAEFEKLTVLMSAAEDIWSNPQGPTAAIERWKKAGAEIAAINQRLAQQVDDISGRNDPSGLLAGVDRRIGIQSGKGDLPPDINSRTFQKLGAAPVLDDDAEDKARALRDRLTEAERAAQRLKDAGQAVWEQTRTPLEKYQIELRNLNDLLEANVIDMPTYQRAVKQLQDEFTGAADAASGLTSELDKQNEVMQQAAESIGNRLGDAFSSLIDGSADAKDAIRSFAADALKQLSNLVLSNAFQSVGTMFSGGGMGVAPSQQSKGGGAGGILGTIFQGIAGSFGGFFAEGGKLGYGQWGIAGEAGPEVITGPANIMPTSALGGGEVHVMVSLSDDLRAEVDSKVAQGVRVSVVESQRATERNFTGMQRQARVRKG